MAFNGYLIKVGGSGGTELPINYIKVEGYEITPNQRMESEAKRDVTGGLHRTTVPHTSSKIEFHTRTMTNTELEEMMSLFRQYWSNELERKLLLEYYDMETDSYKEGQFYMPDIKFPINRIDGNKIYYNEIRIAFIEY